MAAGGFRRLEKTRTAICGSGWLKCLPAFGHEETWDPLALKDRPKTKGSDRHQIVDPKMWKSSMLAVCAGLQHQLEVCSSLAMSHIGPFLSSI